MAFHKGRRISVAVAVGDGQGRVRRDGGTRWFIPYGRKRRLQASRDGGAGQFPDTFASERKKSNIMIAFFLTMPISSKRPRKADEMR